MTLRLSRRRRQAARRRGDILDGRSGRAVAREGAAARSAAEFHRRRATTKWRRATRATWRSASSRWRRFPAATARPGGMGRRQQYLGAQEFHAGADLSAERESRRRRRRQDQGEAARHADRVQAARQGGERAGPLRLRDRRDADPSGTGGAAGAAALRAARRHARSRARRPRRRRAGRRRLRVDIGARSRHCRARRVKVSSGSKTSPRVSMCAPAFPSRKLGAQSVKLGFKIERDADHARDAVEIDLPVKPDRAPMRRYEIVEIAAGESTTLPAVSDGLRPESFSRKIVLAGDPAVVKLVARTQRSGRISLRLHGAASFAGALGSRAEGLFADPRGGGAGGAHLRQCEDDRAGDRTVHRRRRARRLLAARARQCLADRLGLTPFSSRPRRPASPSTRRCSTGSPMCSRTRCVRIIRVCCAATNCASGSRR